MSQFEEQIKTHQLIPVVSLPDVESGLKLAEILKKNGLPVAEITFRTAHAATGMAQIKKTFPDILLIAGTVLTTDQVDQAMDAGAKAIVSPGTDPDLVTYCQKKTIPVIPGICTPSEVQMALSLGLKKLKFFPAQLSGGIQMATLLLNVYKDIFLMPTGGITQQNLKDYLAIERVFCCGGTWLAPESMMVSKKWDEIEQRILMAAQSLKTD